MIPKSKHGKHCPIASCAALLLGLKYWGIILDNGRSIAVCPSCWRRIARHMPSKVETHA